MRPDGVTVTLQSITHGVQPKTDMAFDVFANNPGWFSFANNAEHLSRHVARIIGAPSMPGVAERLAWVAAADDIAVDAPPSQGSHVVMARDIWPVLCEDSSAIGVTLAERDGSHPGSLKAEAESTDAAEQVEDIHRSRTLIQVPVCHT